LYLNESDNTCKGTTEFEQKSDNSGTNSDS
jgi:hypothetical protein